MHLLLLLRPRSIPTARREGRCSSICEVAFGQDVRRELVATIARLAECQN